MRLIAASGIAIALATLAGGAEAREVSIYRGKCGVHVLPTGPAGLPGAIQIRTNCGTFRIGSNGRVAQVLHARLHLGGSKESRAVVVYSPESRLKSVYLLESGEEKSMPLYSHRSRDGLWSGVCAEGLLLSRRGSWLLYTSGEGDLVAIETHSRRVFDLARVLSHLPGGRAGAKGKISATVSWA
jgi:hypothetical protein